MTADAGVIALARAWQEITAAHAAVAASGLDDAAADAARARLDAQLEEVVAALNGLTPATPAEVQAVVAALDRDAEDLGGWRYLMESDRAAAIAGNTLRASARLLGEMA